VGDCPVWGLGERLITSHCKKPACYETLQRASDKWAFCEHGKEPLGAIKVRNFLAS
jgi:hypothetical protein